MYSDKFNTVIPFILQHEEEFARGHDGDENYVVAECVPGDSGGDTKFGIDQSSHPSIDVDRLTKAQAVDIYWNEWTQHHCDLLPAKYSYVFFDIWVNGGPAVKMLQVAVNAAVDGYMGPVTIACAVSAGDPGVVRYLIQRRRYYLGIVSHRPSQGKFLHGWLDRNADLAAFVGLTDEYKKLTA